MDILQLLDQAKPLLKAQSSQLKKLYRLFRKKFLNNHL